MPSDISYLNEIVTHGASEDHVSQESGVVARAQTDLHQSLSVTQDIELRQHDIGAHLDTVVSSIPGILEVRHGVAKALNLNCAHLGVKWEMGKVHWTGSLQENIL